MNRDVTVKFMTVESKIIKSRNNNGLLTQLFPKECFKAEIKGAIECMLITALDKISTNTGEDKFNVRIESGSLAETVGCISKEKESDIIDRVMIKINSLDEQKYSSSFNDLYLDKNIKGITLCNKKIFSFDKDGNEFNNTRDIDYGEALKDALTVTGNLKDDFYQYVGLADGTRCILVREGLADINVHIRKL